MRMKLRARATGPKLLAVFSHRKAIRLKRLSLLLDPSSSAVEHLREVKEVEIAKVLLQLHLHADDLAPAVREAAPNDCPRVASSTRDQAGEIEGPALKRHALPITRHGYPGPQPSRRRCRRQPARRACVMPPGLCVGARHA